MAKPKREVDTGGLVDIERHADELRRHNKSVTVRFRTVTMSPWRSEV